MGSSRSHLRFQSQTPLGSQEDFVSPPLRNALATTLKQGLCPKLSRCNYRHDITSPGTLDLTARRFMVPVPLILLKGNQRVLVQLKLGLVHI